MKIFVLLHKQKIHYERESNQLKALLVSLSDKRLQIYRYAAQSSDTKEGVKYKPRP